MPAARISLHPEFTVGPVPPRLLGSFVEHMGRCVYTGIYEPGHETADEFGLRQDVLELTREIGPTVIRYPGGNFVSGYNWEDGVGPVEQRPRRLDRAWRTTETNEFGLLEMHRWTQAVGTELMMAVNLGTRGLQAACDLLEYANHPGGSKFSDLRKQHGQADPLGVKLWCLGNEMDGPWQTGHKTAEEYARIALETARAMRTVDPDIELVACGSSSRKMPTFGDWERIVLTEAYEAVDYISAHAYYQEHDGDVASFLASAMDMDAFIESVIATADGVRAAGKHSKHINISFDEWNVWYQSRPHHDPDAAPWGVAPRVIEDEYSVTDAVVVGTLLSSLLRHADRVTVGCQAQLVNVIGLLRSEPGGPAWKQTIAYPFELVRKLATGEILQLSTTGDRYDSADFTDVPVVDASATWDAEARDLTLFLTNRSTTESSTVEVDIRGFGDLVPGQSHVLAAPEGDPEQVRHATNTADAPNRVVPQALRDVTVDGGTARVQLPPLSWAAVRLQAA